MFGLGDGSHPDEVIGAGEEGGERRGERAVAAHAESDRGRHQLLLGDVHLEVALGILLRELVGEGRVAHLAVHRDDIGAGTERGQRLAVGLAGCDLVPDGVDRERHHDAGVRCATGRPGLVRSRTAHDEVPFPAQFDDRSLGHLRRERLAVPALPVLDLGEAAALDGPGQDDGRLVAGDVARLGHGPVDLGHVVAVDGEDAGAERRRPAAVGLHIPGQLGRAALPEPVDIHHGDQVRELVVRGLVEGLPDRPLGHLAVTAQHPHPERRLVEVLAGQRDPDGVGESLAKRAGRHVDPGQHRGRVTLQPGSQAAVTGHELVVTDDPYRLVDRVEQGRRVTLGKDQVIVGGVGRLIPVIVKVPADQDGQQVRGRHARRRVTRPGRRARPYRINPQLLGQLGRQLEINVGLHDSWRGHEHLQAWLCAAGGRGWPATRRAAQQTAAIRTMRGYPRPPA